MHFYRVDSRTTGKKIQKDRYCSITKDAKLKRLSNRLKGIHDLLGLMMGIYIKQEKKTKKPRLNKMPNK